MSDPRVRSGIRCTCEVCGDSFLAWPSTIVAGQAKHCSKDCADIGRRKPDAECVGAHTGHGRAQKTFPTLGRCSRCRHVPATERHHRDGDQMNNAHENIQRLCHRCHMVIDGRLELFSGTSLPGELNGVSKLTWPIVQEIRAEWAPGKIRVLATKYRVGTSTIWRVVTNESWKSAKEGTP